MIGRGAGGSAAHLLCSRSAAAAGTGWRHGCPGCRGSQPEESTRDRGRGAAGGTGPAASAPLSPHSATRVGSGER